MSAEPSITIEVPESVIDAVEDALRRHLDVMKQYETQHRDRADRVSWAFARYRTRRFREVWFAVQRERSRMEGLAPETKAEMRSYIGHTKHTMPRSKANAAMYAAQKAEERKQREAFKEARKARRMRQSG